MEWNQLLSSCRHDSKNNKLETYRSPFHKDYDRIIFSESFRQLNQKTQVHSLTKQARIHNRLTHSLEVSCIGRSLGMMSAEKIKDSLPEHISPADMGVIVQAACVAHDIGNPPFGHVGEHAIRDWFKQDKALSILNELTDIQRNDVLHFEGNAQGFRIVTRNEYHPNTGGMRLTCATLGAFLKYPWLPQDMPIDSLNTVSQQDYKKFGVYHSEHAILTNTAEHLGLVARGTQGFCRHPLAYLLESADDICYALIDLEDGIEMGMLNYSEIEELFVSMLGDAANIPPELSSKNSSIHQKLASLRAKVMNHLVDEVSTVFANKQQDLLAGKPTDNLLKYAPNNLKDGIASAKKLARQKIFNHHTQAKLELVVCVCLHIIMDNFIPLALPQDNHSFKSQKIMHILTEHGVQLSDDIYNNLMSIMDYISSLTDNQALTLSQELTGQPHLKM